MTADSVRTFLLHLWMEHLGCDEVQPSDDLFELGADSLAAMRITAEVRERYGVDLSGDAIFRQPTVDGLLEHLRSLWSVPSEREEAASGQRQGPRRSVAPVTFSQERMWLLDHMGADLPLGNVVASFHVEGDLDVDALHGAVRELVRRHEILRTVFVEGDQGLAQMVDERLEPRFRVVDLSSARSSPGMTKALEAAIGAGVSRRHDPAAAPSLRIELLRRDPADHHLLLFYHRILLDAWGLELLLAELSDCYSAALEGRPPRPPSSDRIADVASRQREWAGSPRFDQQLTYWSQALAGAPERIDFAIARRRPAMRTGRGAVEWFDVAEGLLGQLQQIARQHRSTVFPILLTGFVRMLHSYTGQSDVVVGVPVANRVWPGSTRAVGCLVNMLPVRVRMGECRDAAEVLDTVRRAVLEAYANQEVPLEAIVRHLRPDRTAAHAPVIQVVFGLEPQPLERLRLGGAAVNGSFVHTGTANFDFAMMLAQAKDGYKGWAEYATDLLDRSTVREMIAVWSTAIRELALKL